MVLNCSTLGPVRCVSTGRGFLYSICTCFVTTLHRRQYMCFTCPGCVDLPLRLVAGAISPQTAHRKSRFCGAVFHLGTASPPSSCPSPSIVLHCRGGGLFMSDFSEHEYRILNFVDERKRCYYLDVINQFDPSKQCNETKRLLNHLLSKGTLCYLSQAFPMENARIGITPFGTSLLEAHRERLSMEQRHAEEMAQQAAKKKAEKKSDRRFQLTNTLLGALVGAGLTLVVEHFSEILTFLRGLH